MNAGNISIYSDAAIAFFQKYMKVLIGIFGIILANYRKWAL
jgi:hypothetical protein